MKFFSKLTTLINYFFYFWCFFHVALSWAYGPAILITAPSKYENLAHKVEKILLQKYHIPPILIQRQQQALPCQTPTEEPILHLCIDERGELLAPIADLKTISNSMQVLYQ